MKRYKVWQWISDVQIGRLLLRTGSSEISAEDIGAFDGEARHVIRVASKHASYVGKMFVKDFDTGQWWLGEIDAEGRSLLQEIDDPTR